MPSQGWRAPKNTRLHEVLSTNCTPNNRYARRLVAARLITIRNSAVPIKTYRVVQTGANTQLGGNNGGLSRKTYHESILLLVATEPMTPAASEMTTQPINCPILLSIAVEYVTAAELYVRYATDI